MPRWKPTSSAGSWMPTRFPRFWYELPAIRRSASRSGFLTHGWKRRGGWCRSSAKPALRRRWKAKLLPSARIESDFRSQEALEIALVMAGRPDTSKRIHDLLVRTIQQRSHGSDTDLEA